MSEKYSKFFSLPENLYTAGAPVVIRAGALLKDNETNTLIAQLKLQNVSHKAIKLVKVQIDCLDSINRPLCDPIEYEYLDLNALRDATFGTQSPVRCLHPATRSYTVQVKEVAFADRTVWTAADGAWESIPSQAPISSLITSADALCVYGNRYGNEARFVVQRYCDLWLCTCGAINHHGEHHCHSCGAAVADLEAIDLASLKREGIYLRATALFAENTVASLESAKKAFESILDYKDSSALIAQCDEKILSLSESLKEKKNRRKLACILSGAIVMLGLLGYFVAYPLIAKATGHYAPFIKIYNVTEFTVPEGTTKIKDEAFRLCYDLKSVTIPDSVTSIGVDAFRLCKNLTNVTIPEAVTSIRERAFYCCEDIVNITIPEGVTCIGEGTFEYCEDLISITIPDSVTSIGEWAFYDCDSLTSVTIGNGVTSIGEYAFGGCQYLYEIYYVGTVEEWEAISGIEDAIPDRITVRCTDGTWRK